MGQAIIPGKKFGLKHSFNLLSANPTKWLNTLKQFGLALKGLKVNKLGH